MDNQKIITNSKDKTQYNSKNSSKKIIKFIVFSFLFILFFVIIFILLQINNNSTKIENKKYNLEFIVFDAYKDTPIPSADFFINNNYVGKTDSNGFFSYQTDLEQVDILVKADDFQDWISLNESLKLGINEFIIKLLLKNTYAVFGYLVPLDTTNYNFFRDSLLINNQNILIKQNGYFEVFNIKNPILDFDFRSPNFRDIKNTYTLKMGFNDLGKFLLEKSGDIRAEFLDYINENPIENVLVEIEGLSSDKINLERNKLHVKDLNVSTVYSMRISSDGYNLRNYSVKIDQGENSIKDLKMVPIGRIAFYGTNPRNKNLFGLYLADFDGENLETVFEFNRNSSADIKTTIFKLFPEEKSLYFASDFEKLGRNSLGGFLPIYKYDLVSKNIERLTNNYRDLFDINFNFKANIIVNYRNFNKNKDLYFQDLFGEQIFLVKNYGDNVDFKSAIIPDSGDLFYYIETLKDLKQDRLIIFFVDSRENLILETSSALKFFDINKDGSKLLFERIQNNNTKEVVLFDLNSKKFTVVRQNFPGRNFQFNINDESKIIFVSTRVNQTKISEIDLFSNQENVILNYSLRDPILYFYQMDKYIIYGNSSNEYILEYQKPLLYKLVRNL